jgi:hypothetical protein
MRLYRINLKGSLNICGTPYVIANDPGEAYGIVKKFLQEEDVGYDKDREMRNIELLADTVQYPPCGDMLFISKDV